MLRLCHSRAPASEGTSILERSTGSPRAELGPAIALAPNTARGQHSTVPSAPAAPCRFTRARSLHTRANDGSGG